MFSEFRSTVKTGIILHISCKKKNSVSSCSAVFSFYGALFIFLVVQLPPLLLRFIKTQKVRLNILFIQILSSIENYNKYGLKISNPY